MAREGLAQIVRYFREEIMGMSRMQLALKTGVSKKSINRLEHASPRQARWEIEPILKFFKLPRHKRTMESEFRQKRMLALEFLDTCFPAEILTLQQEKEIPQHLLAVFSKRNRKRVRRFRQWPHKVRSHHSLTVRK